MKGVRKDIKNAEGNMFAQVVQIQSLPDKFKEISKMFQVNNMAINQYS